MTEQPPPRSRTRVSVRSVVEAGDDLKEGRGVKAAQPRHELAERLARAREHLGTFGDEIGVGVLDELRRAPHIAALVGEIGRAVLQGDEPQAFALGIAAVAYDRLSHEPLEDKTHAAARERAGHRVGVVYVPVAVGEDRSHLSPEIEHCRRAVTIHAVLRPGFSHSILLSPSPKVKCNRTRSRPPPRKQLTTPSRCTIIVVLKIV